jgi:hypothetical protein
MAPIFLFPKTSIDSHMKSHEISWILVLRLVLSPRRNQKQRKHLPTLPWELHIWYKFVARLNIYIYYIIYILYYIIYIYHILPSNQKKNLTSVRSPHEIPMEITKKASRGLVRGPGFSLGNESRGRRLVSMCLTRKVDLIYVGRFYIYIV